MSIVDMSKFTLIGMNDKRESVLSFLSRKGAVQIDDHSQRYSDDQWRDCLKKTADESNLAAKEEQLMSAQRAYDLLCSRSKVKKALFAPKRTVPSLAGSGLDKAVALAQKLNGFEQELASLAAANNSLKNKIMAVTPYLKYQLPLDYRGSSFTDCFYGSMPAKPSGVEDFIASLGAAGAEAQSLLTDGQVAYLSIVCHKAFSQEVSDILKENGFTKADFSEYKATAADAIADLNAAISRNQSRITELENSILGLASSKDLLECLIDKLTIMRDAILAEQRLVYTERTFVLEGWIPTHIQDELCAEIAKKFTAAFSVAPPEQDEAYPILLNNPGIVKPFEIITQQYSLPKPRGFDPNKIMAPFYFLFFGMMLSDAGYGFLLTVVSFFVLLKYKPGGMAKQMFSLLGLCGISTMFWGAMFGSYFGNFLKDIPFFAPLLYDPVEKPMSLLLLSFVLGIVHLVVGLCCNGYIQIRDGKPFSALFDSGSWIAILIGAPLLAVGSGFTAGLLNEPPVVNQQLMDIGSYLCMGGALVVLLTAGRNEKGIFKKITGGFGSLYGISGYLSDVLSYSRLLALGLATGVIATVINTMGAMGGPVVYVIVFVLAHILNLGINALGAYVHSCRLQYVEFFGKFYESGGQPFRPFSINTKFVNFKED